MRVTIVTTIPEFFNGPLSVGVMGRAVETGLLDIRVINLRDYTDDRHRTTDDYPYGGGAGMVMLPEPVFKAVRHIKATDPEARFVLTSPKGHVFDQHTAKRLSELESMVLFCGRYEGVDERVRHLFDEQISLGDFILSGGEPAVLAVLDSVARLVPGVLGNKRSLLEESFSEPMLEYPQYTRPGVFEGLAVPEVLLCGDHARIREFRRREAIFLTRERRPDLYAAAALARDEIKAVKERSLQP